MRSLLLILSMACFAPSTSLAQTDDSEQSCGYIEISPAWRDYISRRYIEFWSVTDDEVASEIANEIMSPNIANYWDRLPGVNDSVAYPAVGIEASIANRRNTRAGYDPYQFISLYTFGSDNRVAYRWTLNATLKEPDKTFPRAVAPVGTRIAYNGTNTYTLNRCTGKIDSVDMAQDVITWFDALGYGPVVV